jgi:Uncharacterized protein conserved in bacteria (DUF2184)
MFLNSLKNRIELMVAEIAAPTPLAGGQLITTTDMGMTLCSSGVTITQYGIASNYLELDATPWGQLQTAGTTNVTTEAEVSYGVKRFIHRVPFTPYQLEMARCNNISWVDETVRSALLAWDAEVEAAAIYGIPSHNVPGLLWGSGIPQFTDSLNYFNGSLSGQQMVEGILRWITTVYEGSNYRYSTDTIGMPPTLIKVLNNTNYISGQTASALSVLKERIANSAVPHDIVAISSFESANMMVLLPSGADKIALVSTQPTVRALPERLETVGIIAGVIPVHPNSSAIVRLTR